MHFDLKKYKSNITVPGKWTISGSHCKIVEVYIDDMIIKIKTSLIGQIRSLTQKSALSGLKLGSSWDLWCRRERLKLTQRK